MKKQTNQRLQSVFLASITTIFIFGALSSAFAQANKKGAITEKEVKDFLIYGWTRGCAPEDECTITYDSAVRIAPAVRHTFQIPPTTYLTYPVKVDYTTHSNKGTFHLNHHTRAVYYFYRNSFGEWEMGMENEETKEEKDEHQPGGTTKVPGANNQPRTGAQTTKTDQPKADTTAENKDDAQNWQPKIDFSEMEKYFEVVRYEYPTPPANEMFFYLKAKVEQGARPAFYIQFRDKDGILVGAQNDYGNGISMTKVFYTAIGETGKASAYIPSEKEMEKVVSAKVVRIKQ
ncbi:MAG: hypothetical protein ACR2HG_10365 [Pyrinomonadaceae bacterium]